MARNDPHPKKPCKQFKYLSRKTKSELLNFGRASGIFNDEKAQVFLYEILLKKRRKYSACTKAELVRLFIESGVELRGKLPEEVLSMEAGNERS